MKEHSIPKIWNKIKELINGKLDKGSFTGTAQDLKTEIDKNKEKTSYIANTHHFAGVKTYTKLCSLKKSIGLGAAQYSAIVSGANSYGAISNSFVIDITTRNVNDTVSNIQGGISVAVLGRLYTGNAHIYVCDDGDYYTYYIMVSSYQAAMRVKVLNVYGDAIVHRDNTTSVTPNQNNVYTMDITLLNNIFSTYNCDISKNRSGYCKLANGMIIQWGCVSAVSSGTTVSFPVAFTTGTPVITATVIDVSSHNSWIKGQTTTSFTLAQAYTGNGLYTNWIAVGY